MASRRAARHPEDRGQLRPMPAASSTSTPRMSRAAATSRCASAARPGWSAASRSAWCRRFSSTPRPTGSGAVRRGAERMREPLLPGREDGHRVRRQAHAGDWDQAGAGAAPGQGGRRWRGPRAGERQVREAAPGAKGGRYHGLRAGAAARHRPTTEVRYGTPPGGSGGAAPGGPAGRRRRPAARAWSTPTTTER